MADALTDADLTRILGAKCPGCGWRRGQHRPSIPGMGVEPCPHAIPDHHDGQETST